MVGGNLIFDKRGTFLFYFQGSQQGFPTQVSNRAFQLRFPTEISSHGSQHGSGQQAPAYTQVINRISTSYQQNQSLKLGADFRIFLFNTAPIVFEKFWGPPFLKRAPCDPHWGLYNVRHQSGLKKIFWGVGWFYTKEKTVSNSTRL